VTLEFRLKLLSVLGEVYDKKDFRLLARMRLEFPEVRFEDAVNFDESDKEIASQIVKLAEQHGRVGDLVRAVKTDRPNSAEVAALVVAWERGSDAARAASAGIPAKVKDAVIRFNERFQQRQKEFRRLNALKQLHDLLHDLRDFHAKIREAAASLRRPLDDRPDPTPLTDQLQNWVEQSRESAKVLPTTPLRWLASFEKAVQELSQELTKSGDAAIEAAKVDRAVETLANLPANEQKTLNERLFECALRLETDELIQLMDNLLADLKLMGAAGAGTEELRVGVERFRSLCQQLTGLIDEHNLCQDVDGALQEAVGLTEVTLERLSQWNDIKGWLEKIAVCHPKELRATRPTESARLFQEAAEAGDRKKATHAFQALLERFNALFWHTDKALLEVTRDLIFAVQVLDAILKGFK
jgi:hypothetical protein